jgi:acyl-CoA thioester hydrolase
MIRYQTSIRVRYAETDQMGYVHHSRYALYLEEARMELLHAIGLNYAALEKEGVIMPVVEMEHRFTSPLRFGDKISIDTEICAPWGPKLVFRYRIYNQHGKLISRAKTSLVFADRKSGALITDIQKYLEYFRKAEMAFTV